jgi:tRNA(Ile)-lysidine synthetase-like protein
LPLKIWELGTGHRVLLYHFFVHGLTERLLKTIRKQGSIRAGDRMAVAVSGGADSVALLCLLLELQAELGIVLSVAHVNHKLRGEESEEDQRFVAQLAGGHGLELHVCCAPVPVRPNGKAGSGIEAEARRLRYDFFRELAREGRVTKIATAHTLDDQAETVLLRIFRGTGIRGLSGIHPRIIFEEQGRTFGEVVRPLLEFRRASLLELLRERDQSWREDSSNRDVAFLRNRLRHGLLPRIAEEFGEAAIEHLSELAEIARAEEEHWELGHPEVVPQSSSAAEAASDSPAVSARLKPRPFKTESKTEIKTASKTEIKTASKSEIKIESGTESEAKFETELERESKTKSKEARSETELLPPPETRQAVSLRLAPLLALPLATQRRLMRGWIEAHAPDLAISFRLIEEALDLARGSAGKKLELPAGHYPQRRDLRRGRQELLFEQTRLRNCWEPGNYEHALAVPGWVEVPELGTKIEARVIDVAVVPEDERGQLLDMERVPRKVVIRNWRAGDRYWPAHTAGSRKVKELLSDRHATGAEKKLWPVASADNCGLLWMRGFAVPAALRAPPGASRAIWIRELVGMM